MSHSPDEFNFGDIVNSFFPKVNEAVRNVASIISRDNPIRPTKSNSDPYSSTAVSYQDLSNSNNVYLGIVAEVLPFYGWYKVISFGNYGMSEPASIRGAMRHPPTNRQHGILTSAYLGKLNARPDGDDPRTYASLSADRTRWSGNAEACT